MLRRCDKNAQELCKLCSSIQAAAEKAKSSTLTLTAFPEYSIVKRAVFARHGVQMCKQYWDQEVQASLQLWQEYGEPLPDDYPYFEVDHIIYLLMVKGRVIFKNGGQGGRTYARSKIVVEAQDDYLRKCMGAILTILQFEDGGIFKERWDAIMRPARLVHEEMALANRAVDRYYCGALQAPDLIHEELRRAAEFTNDVC